MPITWRVAITCFQISPYHAEVCYGHQSRTGMSKHRYQLGMEGAGAMTRGAARSADRAGAPPMPQASESAQLTNASEALPQLPIMTEQTQGNMLDACVLMEGRRPDND